VFFNKRIGFSVFRDVALARLAEGSPLDVRGVVALLLAVPEKKSQGREKMRIDESSLRSTGTSSLRSAPSM
jgi:hypothetical protein